MPRTIPEAAIQLSHRCRPRGQWQRSQPRRAHDGVEVRAVLGWFVPICNLFRPAELAAALWRHAHGDDTSLRLVVALMGLPDPDPIRRAAGLWLLSSRIYLPPWYACDLVTASAAQAEMARCIDITVFE